MINWFWFYQTDDQTASKSIANVTYCLQYLLWSFFIVYLFCALVFYIYRCHFVSWVILLWFFWMNSHSSLHALKLNLFKLEPKTKNNSAKMFALIPFEWWTENCHIICTQLRKINHLWVFSVYTTFFLCFCAKFSKTPVFRYENQPKDRYIASRLSKRHNGVSIALSVICGWLFLMLDHRSENRIAYHHICFDGYRLMYVNLDFTIKCYGLSDEKISYSDTKFRPKTCFSFSFRSFSMLLSVLSAWIVLDLKQF